MTGMTPMRTADCGRTQGGQLSLWKNSPKSSPTQFLPKDMDM
jgi:hypothetical protein